MPIQLDVADVANAAHHQQSLNSGDAGSPVPKTHGLGQPHAFEGFGHDGPVHMRAGLLLRWGRATVLAAVAGSTGVMAHLSAGGLLPGPFAMASIFAACGLWAASLLGRPASRRRIVLMVMGCQTFTHLVLTAAVGHRGDRIASPVPAPRSLPLVPTPSVLTGPGGGSGAWMDQVHAANPAPDGPVRLSVPAPVQHLLLDFTGPHALMALAHLVGAAVLGCWLARGERLLWALISLSARATVVAARVLALALRRPLPVCSSPPDARRHQGAEWQLMPRPVRWFTSASASRGPPLPAGL